MSAKKTRKPEEKKKTCFVACPIGGSGSPERKRTDQVLAKIIRPACEALGYDCLPAHEDERPGKITRQIVQRLVESPLVIADLTGPNPNVMYEVGIRNAARMPIVLICQEGQDIPFDLAHNRIVMVDWPDWDAIDTARDKLEAQIRSAGDNKDKASESPVTEYLGAEALLERAGRSTEKGVSEGALAPIVLGLQEEVRGLGDEIRASRSATGGRTKHTSATTARHGYISPDRMNEMIDTAVAFSSSIEEARGCIAGQVDEAHVEDQVLNDFFHEEAKRRLEKRWMEIESS